jgi:predicted ATPase
VRLHEVRAELLLHAQGRDSETAETSLREALAVAQQQGKGAELHAATSLARLWLERGRSNAARELLAPIYSWFTEGFDTPDLMKAKALLDALN